jgi:1-deoxy-D-xylulose-5-phosphate reductoisomerase
MKRVVLLGSTGSIGRQTLDIVREHPDRIRIVGLAAGRDVARLAEQVAAFQPEIFAVGDAAAGAELLRAHPEWEARCAGFGAAAVSAVAAAPRVDVVLNGLLGYAGLRPSLAALEAGTHLALANKESMVVAGELLRTAAAASGASIVPVDSEHSAIHQCLRAGGAAEVRRLVLTASGGPFRTWPRADLARATVADALRHPTWSMGAKISIDSATLMNKGLEIIEAHALFGVGYDSIDVLVHPQSIVHSMVEFVDGSVVAQLGTTDMRLPIWFALHAPERCAADFGRLDLARVGSLSFEALDRRRFPCVELAVEAGRKGGTYPAVLNAANEVAVAALLEERIRYLDVPAVIEATLAEAGESLPAARLDVGVIAAADSRARQAASRRVGLVTAPEPQSW